jgi:S-adenosylmethionine uptake transporter
MLFVAFFSRMFLKERLPRGGLFFAILALLGLTWVVGLKVGEGFTLGVPVIPVLVAIFGAFAAGIAYTAVRAASSQYSSHTIVFWFSMVMTALSLPQLLASGEAFRWEWAPLLLSVGGLATAGQVCMTQAYRFAPAPMVSVLNLLNAPGVALLGYFFFGEVLLPGQWVGIALVGASLSALGWLQYRSSALRSG